MTITAETWTAERAAEELRVATYDGQRKLSTAHTKRLSRRMESGLWLPGSQLTFAACNGSRVLIDGQHRLTAQVESGASIEWSVRTIPAATHGDVARLYGTVDTAQRIRGPGDIAAAFGEEVLPGSSEIPPRLRSHVFRALLQFPNVLTESLGHASLDINDVPDLWGRHRGNILRAHEALYCDGAQDSLRFSLMAPRRLAVVLYTMDDEEAVPHWSNVVRFTPDTWGGRLANTFVSLRSSGAKGRGQSAHMVAMVLKSFVLHKLRPADASKGNLRVLPNENVVWRDLSCSPRKRR